MQISYNNSFSLLLSVSLHTGPEYFPWTASVSFWLVSVPQFFLSPDSALNSRFIETQMTDQIKTIPWEGLGPWIIYSFPLPRVGGHLNTRFWVSGLFTGPRGTWTPPPSFWQFYVLVSANGMAKNSLFLLLPLLFGLVKIILQLTTSPMRTPQIAQPKVFSPSHRLLGPGLKLLFGHLMHTYLCRNYLIILILLISL